MKSRERRQRKPLVTGWSGLPRKLTIRPFLTVARMLHPSGQSRVQVVKITFSAEPLILTSIVGEVMELAGVICTSKDYTSKSLGERA